MPPHWATEVTSHVGIAIKVLVMIPSREETRASKGSTSMQDPPRKYKRKDKEQKEGNGIQK
jgi:hypothetical protein